MFCLYQVQDAGSRLYPRDFQFIQTPRAAFSNARIYYEMDYRCYARQDISSDLPQRKTTNNDRFNPSDQYSGNNGYDPLYDATERGLNSGGIIGIDTSERWDPFYHPFYFDAESNLVFGGSRELRASPFEQAVRRAYEICLKRHHGKKPAPTLKKHYVGDPDQQASPGKTINSKSAGRLLAAGGVYNGNVEGFRKTAEQLGGEAVKGYDQVLNETTKGAAIAVASITAGLGKARLNSLTRIDSRGLTGGQIVVENNALVARGCAVLLPCRTLEIGVKAGVAGLAGAAIKDVADKMTSDELNHFITLELTGNDEVTGRYLSSLQDKYGSGDESKPNLSKDLTNDQKKDLRGTGSGTPGGWEPQDEENARNNESQKNRVDFDAAKDKYPKQYDQYNKLPDKNLEKAISKHIKQITEHTRYLNDSIKRQEHVPDWNNLSPQHQENLLHHWQQDIKRHEAYKTIAENILKGRK